MYGKYAEQYRKVGATSSILEADPHKLVQLLLEGAGSRLRLAMACLERGDQPGKGKAISRACDIVSHLASTLNQDQGGEIAQNLLSLYDYILVRMTQGNLNNDKSALEEAQRLLAEIEAGWSSMNASAGGTP